MTSKDKKKDKLLKKSLKRFHKKNQTGGFIGSMGVIVGMQAINMFVELFDGNLGEFARLIALNCYLSLGPNPLSRRIPRNITQGEFTKYALLKFVLSIRLSVYDLLIQNLLFWQNPIQFFALISSLFFQNQ